MGKNIFVPPLPHIDPPDDEAIENLKNMSRKDLKALSRNPNVRKYTDRVFEREKQDKREARREWWWTNGIQIVNLILALIAAITGIISLLK